MLGLDLNPGGTPEVPMFPERLGTKASSSEGLPSRAQLHLPAHQESPPFGASHCTRSAVLDYLPGFIAQLNIEPSSSDPGGWHSLLHTLGLPTGP